MKKKSPTSGSKPKRKPAPSRGRRKTTCEEPSREDEGGVAAGTIATQEDGGAAAAAGAQDEGTAVEANKKPGNAHGALEAFAKATLQKRKFWDNNYIDD